MPRVKDASDWLLTWSPPDDSKDIPPKIKDFMEGPDVRRYIAVREYSHKWHIHIAFSTVATYNSDYANRQDKNGKPKKTWWEKPFAAAGFKHPAIDIKYHNDIIKLAGGYLEGEIIANKGFSQEQLEYGKQQYQLRKQRQKIRQFIDDHIVVSRDKYEVCIGAIKAANSCSEQEAISLAAEMGFAFGNSRKGMVQAYEEIFREKMEMS